MSKVSVEKKGAVARFNDRCTCVAIPLYGLRIMIVSGQKLHSHLHRLHRREVMGGLGGERNLT